METASTRRLSLDTSSIELRSLIPPLLLEYLLRTTVGMVNVLFLSRISASAVNAAGVSNQYIGMSQIIATAVATGTIICLNQAVGMQNEQKVQKLATIACGANLIVGLAFSLIFLLCSDSLLLIMQLDQQTALEAERYMQIVGGSMALQCCQIAFSSISRSMGRVRAPLLVNLLENAINLLGCWLVIFQPFTFPLSGIVGVAIVNVASKIAGLVLSGAILYNSGIRPRLSHLWPFPWAELKMSLLIGIPAGVNNIAYSASQLATTALVALTGSAMISAKIYITNVVSYVAVIGMACSQASSILIGYKVGKGDYPGVMKLCSRVTVIALCTNLCLSLTLLVFCKPLMQLFTSDPVILSIAVGILMIDVLVEIGRALNNSLSGALQATGDVTFQLFVNQSCAWLVSVGLSYLLGIRLGWGLYGIWAAFAADELLRGSILLMRWHSRRWQAKAELCRNVLSQNTV